MKVKMNVCMASENAVFESGQIVELDDAEAGRLIAAGYAEEVERKIRTETAIKSAPEEALKPKRKG